MLTDIAEQAGAQTLPEIVAVVTAILYLVFAIRENIVCWLFAAVSSLIYVWLFVVAKLYMESALYAFYALIAAYGWYSWHTGCHEGQDKPVVVWSRAIHGSAIPGIAVLSALSGYLLETYTDAAYPYVDSTTTWSAIWATYLVARKVLENWWYWLLIDIVSVIVYWLRDLQLTSILFVVYVIMIPIGLISWKKSMYKQSHTATV